MQLLLLPSDLNLFLAVLINKNATVTLTTVPKSPLNHFNPRCPPPWLFSLKPPPRSAHVSLPSYQLHPGCLGPCCDWLPALQQAYPGIYYLVRQDVCFSLDLVVYAAHTRLIRGVCFSGLPCQETLVFRPMAFAGNLTVTGRTCHVPFNHSETVEDFVLQVCLVEIFQNCMRFGAFMCCGRIPGKK